MTARMPGLLSAAMVAGVAVLYIAIIRSEDEANDLTVVVVFAGMLLIAAAAALLGALVSDPYWRRLAFGIAAAITLACAWVSGFSIGILLVPAVILLAFGFGRG
jgi:hypothetical protein